MPSIDTYSPRKVTDQNRDLLPSNHDPKKRTTYVQITLNEPEIKEAIRNYIRAQVPIIPSDELPVKIIAGRGENGHSAEITVSVGEYTVNSPERPTAPMASFEAAAEDAAARNNDTEGDTDMEAEDTACMEAAEDMLDEISAESAADLEEAIAGNKSKTTVPVTEVKAVKKSSLFDKVTPKPTADTVAAEAAAAPPQTEHSQPAEKELPTEEEAPAPKKAKSIFDA